MSIYISNIENVPHNCEENIFVKGELHERNIFIFSLFHKIRMYKEEVQTGTHSHEYISTDATIN